MSERSGVAVDTEVKYNLSMDGWTARSNVCRVSPAIHIDRTVAGGGPRMDIS